MMKKVIDVSVHVKSILDDIEELLEAEHKEHKQDRLANGEDTDSSFDSSSDDEQSMPSKYKANKAKNSRKIKLREFMDRYDLFLKQIKTGNESNQALHEAFNSVIKSLQILSLPLAELTEKLPTIEPIDNEESKQVKERLVSLLAKVEEMKSQRDELTKRFQRAILDDDLTKVIASHQNEIEDPNKFFQDQLKKHEQLTSYIQQNLQAQDNILRALAEANASFAVDRKKIVDATQKRNAYIDNLIFSYQSVSELSEKVKKGIVYYENLNEPVNKLFNEVKEFCGKFKQERENKKRIMDRVNSIASNNKFQANSLTNNLTNMSLSNPLINQPPVNNYRPKPVPQSPQQQQQQPQQPIPNQINQRFSPAQSSLSFNSMNNQLDMSDLDASDINEIMASLPPSTGGERPKLKDFLPLMKPKSWGGSKGKPGPPVLDRNMANFEQAAIKLPQQQQQVMPINQIANPQIPVQFNPRLNNLLESNYPAQIPQASQNNQYPNPQNQINPPFQQHNQMNMIPNQQQIQNPAIPKPNVNFQQAQLFQQQQIQLDQQNQLIQQQKLAEQERQRQQREQEEQQARLRQQQREYEEKQAQLSQQKILDQKLLEQQLFEKELQIKKQQLEQQEQQLRLQQQQIQMQQQQQQYLLMQQQQQYQQKLAEPVINQQQFSNPNSNGLYQTQNVPNTQNIPAQLNSAQNIQYQPVVMQPATNINSQVLPQPAPNQQKTTVENKKPELNVDLLAKIDPVSVYKPGYFNQINLTPSAIDAGLNNTQTKPVHNNFQTNFAIKPQADIKPTNNINPTTYNQNLAQVQAQPIMPNQQYQQFPISQQQMNIQPQAQPKPPVQSKPKAIDELFDLFDNKNYNQNNTQPTLNVLQPKLADVFTTKQIVDLNQIGFDFFEFLFFKFLLI